jgi:hypothetical protein
MKENPKIKDELFSLYKNILNDIPNNKSPTARPKNKGNMSTLDSITLITYIKETIPVLISHKISEAISINSNNNEFSIEIEENMGKKGCLQREYAQLENQLRKLEYDNKYYLKKYMMNKIQKDALEMKLNAYMSIQEEYEDLKEKVKFKEGKFLENERKDNEIIILRTENSSLKKEIVKLEKMNIVSENKNKELQHKIKNLQSNIEYLNKKIYLLDKEIKEKNMDLNINKTLIREKNMSCVDFRIINNNSHKRENNINYNNSNNIKTINSHIIFNVGKNKDKKSLNFHSPKNDIFLLEKKKHNKNLFSSTYNKIDKINKINKFKNKNIHFIKRKEFNTLRHIKNNSITIIKIQPERTSSNSANKYNSEIIYNNNVLNNSYNKIKFNSIINSNRQVISPLSCKNYKNNKNAPKNIS